MFSKEESKNIREEFWTGFGKAYSKKWILYDTKMKELQLKFSFDNRTAKVSMDISSRDELIRAYYFEKITVLKTILHSEYLPDATFAESFLLPEGKTISSIFVELKNVNIHNKKHWPTVNKFFYYKMNQMEAFFLEYETYIND
ncbi:DUF4268 domain-containing protein [Gillisia limnaea]|uniref:DUF4268 domain-containing protein n=1 Tax=Gillisia limnaea (strain DSM 15749 / LMG 21470 / R-8282) TaxID=865937 RepID=H2BV58_GILLR|nr:DUF4268 domain-containing protein [Gillisia limnaea]EHQ03948.1 hypothetical protein Gilli_3347 [Gillisia limnaea DSM 15749]